MESPKPYNEFAVFVVLMFLGFMLLAFLVVRDHIGVNKYCDNYPTHCSPSEYPGKVVQK
jgi:hypothetical protein